METIKGTIQKVTEDSGTSKVSGKPFKRWTFEIENKKYSTFDEAIGKGFVIGDHVELTGQMNGQYFNMKTMAKIDKTKEVSDNSEVADLLRQILAELKGINREDGN